MATKAAPRTIVVRTPSTSRARLARAAGGVARRGLVGAARAALTERHTLTALVTAAALGYVQRSGTSIPHIAALGVDGSVGALLWVAGRYTRNPMLQHAATGALACAVKGAVTGGAAAPAAAPGAPALMGGGGYRHAPAAGVMGGAF